MTAVVVRVGFTGNKKGLTAEQRSSLTRLLGKLAASGAEDFLHGACIGADEEAARLAAGLGLRLLAFPGSPEGHPKRSALQSDVTFDLDDDPLRRNRTIVASADVLVACPRQSLEIRRSGTWATVRAARKAYRQVILVLPDGTVEVA